jgi:hypothetical protein
MMAGYLLKQMKKAAGGHYIELLEAQPLYRSTNRSLAAGFLAYSTVQDQLVPAGLDSSAVV